MRAGAVARSSRLYREVHRHAIVVEALIIVAWPHLHTDKINR
jgi:hypothetical protein